MTNFYVLTWTGWERIPTLRDVAILMTFRRIVRLGCVNCKVETVESCVCA